MASQQSSASAADALVLFGKSADIAAKPVIATGMVIFALGSFVAAFAHDMTSKASLSMRAWSKRTQIAPVGHPERT
jgi:hypothetical protein